MAGRFMRVKRLVIPILTLIILASQISGCSIMNSHEMVDLINSGQTITIELPKPSYDIVVKGQQQEEKAWVQLDQLQTFKGFRQDFDTQFNINTVTLNSINGKSGCLYIDESNDRNGNSTLANALRNKAFVNKYWGNQTVKQELIKIASDIYTDVDENDTYGLLGSINAYFNLLQDAENPSSFNPSMSLSREQFYTLVLKSEEGVRPIEVDANFEKAIGGATYLSKYAQEVDEYGFLSVANKSLDETSFKGSISRAEAVYMIVNKHFIEDLAKVTGKEKVFSDTKNGGDLALKVGFKYKDKETNEILGKDRWQAYTLAYSVQNPKKGLQEELYRSMVVAKDLGLIIGTESRWDEPISKAEAIELVINTHLAKNSLYGYLSEVEYGKNNINKFNVASEDVYKVLGVDDEGFEYGKDWTEVPLAIVPVDGNKKLSSGMSLQDAKRMIDMERERAGDRGWSEDDTTALLTQLAKDLGTTIEEVSRVQAEPVPLIKKTEPAKTEPAKPDTSPVVNSDKLELKGDKWYTKEEKEAAKARAEARGDTTFERRASQWESLPEWQKEETVSPYATGSTVDTTGMKNPFK